MNTDTRSDLELNRIIQNWHTGELWLICKRGYFYRPGGCGYTDRESEAWKVQIEIAKKHEYLRGEEPVTLRKAAPANYCGDLNAIMDAVKKLGGDDQSLWYDTLAMECPEDPEADIAQMRWITQWFVAVEATARQRAEALVYVIESTKK